MKVADSGAIKKVGKTSGRHVSTLSKARPKNTRLAEDPAQAIVDAAAKCFARWGIPRTRVEDVASEAGIARPHVYRHFASKDAIIHAVVMREIRLHHRRLAERLPLRGRAADIVVGTLISAILDASKDPYMEFLIRSDSVHSTANSVRSSPEIIAEVRAHWEPILDYARQRGELRDDVDIQEATQWITFIEFSYIALPELAPTKNRLEAELRNFVIPALMKL